MEGESLPSRLHWGTRDPRGKREDAIANAMSTSLTLGSHLPEAVTLLALTFNLKEFATYVWMVIGRATAAERLCKVILASQH